jgi:hypothetical protein
VADHADLGDMPKPEAEEPARNPGGVDAINDDPPFAGDVPAPLGHDLDPDDNPAVEDQMPDEVTQLDDKQQEPEGEDSGDTSDPKKEDPV